MDTRQHSEQEGTNGVERQGKRSAHLDEVMLREALEKKSKGDFAGAVELFSDYLKRFGEDLEPRDAAVVEADSAELLFWLGDYTSARRHGEKALVHRNDDAQALSMLGKIALAQYRFREASAYFEKISDDHPARWLGLTSVSIKLRETSQAQHYLAKAQPLVGREDPEYAVYEAYLYLLDGSTEVAISAARNALKLIGEPRRDPSLVLYVAEIFMTAGNYGEALACVDAAAVHTPKNDRVPALRAHAAYAQEHFDEAESHARSAVRLNPANAYAQTILMKVASRRGEYNEAEIIGQEILNSCPQYALGHANLGDLYFMQGRYELAKIEYEQTSELMDSQTKGALLRQARMRFMHGNYSDAAEILERLIGSYHTYYDDAMCDLALCYDALGDAEKKQEVTDKMTFRRTFYHRTEDLLRQFSGK